MYHQDQIEHKNIGIAFRLNLSFPIIELIFGIMINSVAIIADVIHDFGDASALGFAWHLIEDLLGWSAVLVSGVLLIFFHLPFLDPALSLVITVFITFNIIKN